MLFALNLAAESLHAYELLRVPNTNPQAGPIVKVITNA